MVGPMPSPEPSEAVDPYDLREEHWPLLERDRELTESAAVMVAELVRYLNHATNSGVEVAVPYASTLYRTCGALAAAAHGLHQLCQQLAHRAHAMAADPTIRNNESRWESADEARSAAAADLSFAASRLAVAVESAASAAAELGGRLSNAQAAVTWVAHEIPEGS